MGKDMFPLKFLIITFIVSMGWFMDITIAKAYVGVPTFDQVVKESNLIAEGFVSDQSDASIKVSDHYLSKASSFKISKVYKGNVESGQTIIIYSHSSFVCDISAFEKNKEYLLFLKRYNNGFIDTYYGRGQWTIVEENGKKIMKTYGIYSDIMSDYDYAEFVAKLEAILKGNKTMLHKR